MSGSAPTVPWSLAIIPQKSKGKPRHSGEHGSNLFFPLSKALSGQAKVTVVHWGPQHHLALILPGCPDVGSGFGSELLHMVPFTLWGRKINGLFFYCGLAHCTYKTSFWRLEACVCVEPDIRWHVSMECVAIHFEFSLILTGTHISASHIHHAFVLAVLSAGSVLLFPYQTLTRWFIKLENISKHAA